MFAPVPPPMQPAEKRVRATRLAVLRRGKVIAETPPQTARLDLPGRPETADFLRKPR